MKKYKVALTADERQLLHDLVAAGKKAAAKKLAHARILLKADASPEGPAWTDDRIAEAVDRLRRGGTREADACVRKRRGRRAGGGEQHRRDGEEQFAHVFGNPRDRWRQR